MDHVFGRKLERRGDPGLTRGTANIWFNLWNSQAGFVQFATSGRMYGTVNTTTAQHAFVGRIYDGIDCKVGDITEDDLDFFSLCLHADNVSEPETKWINRYAEEKVGRERVRVKKNQTITRRDFLNGFALSLAAGTTFSPLELLALQSTGSSEYYPPSLTGMRGTHPGAFEIAHARAWGGAKWPRPDEQTDPDYDLVVVGGGISGLSAAFLYRQQAGPDARILVLDNHDDFGGHAKRNEFDVDGQQLICYGGSQTIESPGQYSKVAAKLLKDVGIDTQRFYDYFDREYFEKRQLGSGVFFSKEAYGADSVHASVFRSAKDRDIESIISSYPLNEPSRKSLIDLFESQTDYLKGKTQKEKISLLRSISYTDFLEDYTEVTTDVQLLIRDTVKGYWGSGWDTLSALEGWRLGMPGTYYLELGEFEAEESEEDEPYIFHFPDGNAGVARSLVRKLIPDAVPGDSMEDLVLSRVNYSLLDLEAYPTRIRLNSTGVDVRHVENRQSVDVTYVREGQPCRVRGRHVIMACYNQMVPHICPEVSTAQKEAIKVATKIPLVYISVAIRNWKAFENVGYQSFYIPQSKLMHSFGLDFPVSMGGYQFTQKSDQPTVIHGTYCPTAPGMGLTAPEQHVVGRRRLYEMSFEDFEGQIVGQMSAALKGGGFDAERDIAAITVNRWPHGYAYEYNELIDPPKWNRYNGPHIAGAAQIGRISIANSDASAYAYVDGAIDAASRAVNEQLAEG